MDGQAVTEATPVIKFLDGELTELRPVLEQDLETLVHVMNESPLPFGDNKPWTYARLKKKYEDEKDPGLWSESRRWYTLLDRADGSVCGLFREDQRRGGEVQLKLHLFESLERRSVLMCDAIRTYVRFKDGFANISRINAEFLDIEAEKAECLKRAGFIPQTRVPGVCMYLGERRDYVLYSWIPQWVLDRRAPDGGAKE